MKHDLRINKTIQYASIVLLLLAFAFTSIGATSQASIEQKSAVSQAAISNYLAAQHNANLSDEEKIKTAIDAYFTIRYEGQKLVKAQDFSVLVEDNNLAWVNKEKDKREIELYIASLFDLAYQSYKFTLDYDSIEIKDNEAVVHLKQNHQVAYKAVAPQVSKLSGLPHTITLHDKNGIWTIYKDEYEDEYTRLLETTTKDEVKQQVNKNYRISQENNNLEENTLANSISSQPLLPIYYSVYDKNRAIAFADTYAPSSASPAPIPQAIKDAYQAFYGTPYPGGWLQNYRVEPDNDCTNFVSQAVFEGTWYTNGDTNYFYPTPNDNNWYYKFSPVAQGTPTWTRVGAPVGSIAGFYDFLLNTSTLKRGPYGIAVGTTSFCTNIKPGDPIFMKSGSAWQHAVIVSTKSSPCYSPSNILVDSHTPYNKKTPLSTFSGLSWYGVNIMGYIETPYFADVPPTYWAWDDIERIYHDGITAGCGGDNYCPETTLTRAQMAVFILKGEHMANDPGYTPPAATGTVFADVPANSFAAAWIEQLAAEGVTGGCGNNNYCPNLTITHAEMAVFLLRAKYGYTYIAPDATGTMFGDVPFDYWAAKWIEELAREGFSNGAHWPGCGTGTGNYCPTRPVTRAEMAGMLVRTFNLP